jgi:hypothetical protein
VVDKGRNYKAGNQGRKRPKVTEVSGVTVFLRWKEKGSSSESLATLSLKYETGVILTRSFGAKNPSDPDEFLECAHSLIAWLQGYY